MARDGAHGYPDGERTARMMPAPGPVDVDVVNNPPHYTFSKIEVLDAIEAWKLPYKLGQVVKYVARAAHKGALLQDLEKAKFYLDREIKQLKGS